MANEYSRLSDYEYAKAWDEAEAAGDWPTLSKLQDADKPDDGVPEGFATYTTVGGRDFPSKRR